MKDVLIKVCFSKKITRLNNINNTIRWSNGYGGLKKQPPTHTEKKQG